MLVPNTNDENRLTKEMEIIANKKVQNNETAREFILSCHTYAKKRLSKTCRKVLKYADIKHKNVRTLKVYHSG